MFKSKADRDEVIEEYLRLELEIRAPNQNDVARKELLIESRSACAKYYFENLPRIPLSRCPFCNALHIRAFDPWGIDGLWWQYEECIVTIQEPSKCPHFRFLQGAVSFGGNSPKGGHSNAIVGPSSPFVIPRILESKGFIAVIGQFDFGDEFTGWPIGYFSEQSFCEWELHQEWTKPSFSFKLPNREKVYWKMADDSWDFDLRSWIELGSLLWVPPDDSEWRLRRGIGTECPYVGHSQPKGIQIVKGNSIALAHLPNGSGANPFE